MFDDWNKRYLYKRYDYSVHKIDILEELTQTTNYLSFVSVERPTLMPEVRAILMSDALVIHLSTVGLIWVRIADMTWL